MAQGRPFNAFFQLKIAARIRPRALTAKTEKNGDYRQKFSKTGGLNPPPYHLLYNTLDPENNFFNFLLAVSFKI